MSSHHLPLCSTCTAFMARTISDRNIKKSARWWGWGKILNIKSKSTAKMNYVKMSDWGTLCCYCCSATCSNLLWSKTLFWRIFFLKIKKNVIQFSLSLSFSKSWKNNNVATTSCYWWVDYKFNFKRIKPKPNINIYNKFYGS